MQDECGEPLENRLEVGAFDQRNVRGGTQPLDDAMDDRGEQRLLVGEAVIERALGHAQVLRHGIDAGGTEAVREKHLCRRVQDQFAQFLGRFA